MSALIPPAALEGLMRKAFVDLGVEPGLFWDALLKANLYVPIESDGSIPQGVPQEAQGQEEFKMLLGVDSNGQNIFWLFTSPQILLDYVEKNLSYLELPATTLLANARDSEHDVVLIGPDRLTLNLHPELINLLSDGKVPEPDDGNIRYVPKSQQLQVGAAGQDAEPLQQAFADLFKTQAGVLEARFLKISDDAGTRLLLGLKLVDESKDAFRKIAALVARAAEGVLDKGKSLDITLIKGSLENAFEKLGPPFFKR